MQTKEYTTVDKSTWERGEWDNEPDKKQWLDEETGLPCLIVRGCITGALCGYVGVPKGHPAYRYHYDGCSPRRAARNHRIFKKQARLSKRGFSPQESSKRAGKTRWSGRKGNPVSDLQVHGGLTFAGVCRDHGSESKGICHLPEPGESDIIWWLGFDCAHHMDVSPMMNARLAELSIKSPLIFEGCGYRNLAYVTAEVQSLAKQLKAIAA